MKLNIAKLLPIFSLFIGYVSFSFSLEIEQVKQIDCNQIKILSGIINIGQDQRLIRFSPDGKLFASVSDRIVALWSTDKYELIWSGQPVSAGKKRMIGFKWGCFGTDFSPDGKYIVAVGLAQDAGQGDLQVCNIEDGTIVDSVNCGKRDFVRFHQNGKTIVSAKGNNIEFFAWEEEKLKLTKTLQAHDERITWVDFSPDGSILVSGSEDKTVKIWDTENYSLKKVFNQFETQINSVAFSKDGKYIAVAEYANTIYLVDSSKLEVIKSIKQKRLFGVFYVEFSPDSKLLAFTTGNGKIILYDIVQEKIVNTIQAHKMKVYSATFSPDGQYIISSGNDSCLTVWRIKK